MSYLVIVGLCLVLSAFFSGSETALLRLTKDQIDADIEQKSHPSIMAARDLIKTPTKLLVTILLGNNVVNILGASCASALGVYFFGERDGLVISTVLMTGLVLVFAEILPKSIAAKNPTKIGYAFSLPLYIIHKLSMPIHFAYERTIDPLVKKIAGTPGNDNTPHMSTAESVLKMAEQLNPKRNDGTPLPIISLAAKAANLTAQDIMINRTDLFTFPSDTTLSDAEEKLSLSCFTRAIVYSDSLDNVLGSVHLKDLVRSNNSGKIGVVKDIIKPVLTIPERIPILEVLPRMQAAFIHIAVVTNGDGVTLGMLSQEDILEEIVGEIRDEYDQEELKRIKKLNPNKYEVLGRVTLHDFNKESLWGISGDRSDTMGDLLFNHLGHYPIEGELVDFGDFTVKVKQISGNRLVRVEVTKVVSADD